MAGGPSTPELAAAVSNAGGLGAMGVEYLSVDQTRDAIRRTRELTEKPIHVNLFVPPSQSGGALDAGPMLRILEPIHRDLGIAPPIAPSPSPNIFEERFAAVLDARPEVFSSTFGMLSPEHTKRLQACGTFVIGTATTAHEAKLLEANGVDGIVAQGAEAGGHRGTFAASFEISMVPTLELVREIVSHTHLPVIASGGLMTGSDVNRALESGAYAAQLGTAFLACPEAGTSTPYREAILKATKDTSVITRAFSGRPARGLANKFSELLAMQQEIILPFPQQNTLTRAMRKSAGEQNRAEFLSLWAGAGVAKARSLAASELVRVLVEEMNADAKGQKR
jgi:nitronate monooxygenase